MSIKDRNGRLHDALGRFARTGRQKVRAREFDERPGNREPQIRRAGVAFQPPSPSAGRRAAKERVPAAVRELDAIYAKRTRGEQLTWRERNKIEWASPKKSAEQRAKTGDAVKPRAEALRGARGTFNASRPRRTGIKQTFTGTAMVERGNFRELLIPSKDRPDSYEVRLETRVRRGFDWRTGARAKMAPKPAAKPAAPLEITDGMRREFTLVTDQRLRDMARALPGVIVPPRAGRNQLIELILRNRSR